MELCAYWQIVYRRLWIVVALVLIVLAANLIWRSEPPTVYQVTMRFTIGPSPEPRQGSYYTYDKYYTWLASEYMVDDFTEVVKSGAFAADVSRRLADKGVVVPAGAIQGSAATGKQHRILTLTITWPNRDQTLAIAQAAIAALQEDSPKYFPQLGDQPAIAKPLDEPVVGVVPPSLRERLDLPIRLALALVAGIALAFLLDYLDDTVRDAREVEAIGLHVLGEIPPLRGWLIPWRRRLP